MKRFVAIATAACLMISGSAFAETATIFQDRDVNRDGKITLAEFNEHQMARFREMDLDRDGFLTIKDLEHSKGKSITGMASFLGNPSSNRKPTNTGRWTPTGTGGLARWNT